MAERFSDIEKPLVTNQPSSLSGNFLFIRRKTLCVIPLQWCSRTSAGYLGQKILSCPFSGRVVWSESLAVRCLGHCYQLHAKTMGLPLQGEKLALLPLALKFGGAPVHPGLALGDQSIVEAG